MGDDGTILFGSYESCTVTASVPGGGGTVSPASQTVSRGTSPAINVTPDAGCHIASITDNGVPVAVSDPYILENISAGHDIAVAFAAGDYTVSASVAGGYGDVDLPVQYIAHGDSATINITPGSGYHLTSITDNGESKAVADPYVIENTTANHDIEMVFEKDYIWSEQATGTTSYLCDISAVDAAHVWAVGDGGTILFFDGSSWTSQVSGTANLLYGVSTLDAAHVWAVGNGGTILFFDGSSWTSQSYGTNMVLLKVSALDENHVWAVGYDSSLCEGVILFFDGSSWTTQLSGVSYNPFSISALDENHVWAGGAWGNILFFDGSSWSQQETGVLKHLYDIFALDANHVWAVGYRAANYGHLDNLNAILFYDGTSWSEQLGQVGVVSDKVTCISALDENHVWAGGEGNVYFFNGTNWSTATAGVNSYINGICAVDENHVLAVGDNGKIIFGRPATCEVTASVSGVGGTVSPGSQLVAYGDEAVIDVTPDAGYYVASVTDNGAPVSISDPYNIGNIDADHNVVVTFTLAGSVSGTVTDGSSGISGISVRIYDSINNIYTGGAVTGTDGTYTISRLPVGSYRVMFYSPTGTYATQYYSNSINWPTSPNVTVTAGNTTLNINATLSSAGSVSGTVTDGSSGISGISVRIYDSINNIYTGGAVTGTDGTYTISRLPVGSYRVMFYSPTGTYATQYYSNSINWPTSPNVTVTAGNTTLNINATLSSAGSVSGTVTDGSSGISGISVRIYDSINNIYTGGAVTGTDGTYTISRLPVGSYRVMFYSPTGTYATQYYSNSINWPTSPNVTVTAGNTTLNINATLSSAGSVSGTVTDGSSGISGISVRIYDSINNIYTGGAVTGTDGTYTISRLPVGSYRVMFYSPTGTYATQYYSNSINWPTSPNVTVTAGNTTLNINATLSSAGSVSGTVTDGSSGISGISVRIYDSINNIYTGGAVTGTDGTYTISRLPVGSYRVMFYSPTGTYATQYYSNSINWPTSPNVTVTAGNTTLNINATLAPKP